LPLNINATISVSVNALEPILVKPDDNVNAVKDVHPLKALFDKV